MKTSRYFERRSRQHGVSIDHVRGALANEIAREVQPDGRIRVWGYVNDFDKYVRVILLEDGETILNAFPDRSFKQSGRA